MSSHNIFFFLINFFFSPLLSFRKKSVPRAPSQVPISSRRSLTLVQPRATKFVSPAAFCQTTHSEKFYKVCRSILSLYFVHFFFLYFILTFLSLAFFPFTRSFCRTYLGKKDPWQFGGLIKWDRFRFLQ